MEILGYGGREIIPHFSGWFLPIAFVGYVVIAMYVYAPLKVRRQQTKTAHPEFIPIELTDIPPDVSEAFYSASIWLASADFHSIGTVQNHTQNTRQDSYVSIWVNPALNDSAQIIGIRTPLHVGGLGVVTSTNFRTEFSDGTSIVTTSSSTPGCFPRDPRVSGIRCPGIRDIALLYRFHQARVARDRNGRSATLEGVKDPSSRMVREHVETFERLISVGYYRLDEMTQCYVPTYKGAYLMTYRLLPPFKQIRELAKNRLADRALRELGFGGMNVFRDSQQSAPLSAWSERLKRFHDRSVSDQS